MDNTNYIKIRRLLKENLRGLTIQEISNKTKLARNTIMIILARMYGEKNIELDKVGQAKLNKWIGK